jgi:hypothetical protein
MGDIRSVSAYHHGARDMHEKGATMGIRAFAWCHDGTPLIEQRLCHQHQHREFYQRSRQLDFFQLTMYTVVSQVSFGGHVGYALPL